MTRRRYGGLVALWLMMAGATAAAVAPLRLHPEAPEVLESPWLERLAVFSDVPDLQRVTFERAVWGGVVARLETSSRVFERNLPAHQWQVLRGRAALLVAGEELPLSARAPTVADSTARRPVWPEAPPPPAALPRQLRSSIVVPPAGRWLAVVEIGGRATVSGFNEFFSPMGQIGISFAHGVSSHVLPHLGFYAGFGDMRGDFEDAFGDGRTNGFGFTFSTLLRAGLGDRHSLYLEGSGGYHVRSLYWGNVFIDPDTGRVYEGRVDEQRNLGWGLRAGWMRARTGASRPRYLDVGVGMQTMPADQWFYAREGAMFEASHHDTWLMLTVRFWDGL